MQVTRTYSLEEITVQHIEELAEKTHRTLSGVVDLAIERLAQEELSHDKPQSRKRSTDKLNQKNIKAEAIA